MKHFLPLTVCILLLSVSCSRDDSITPSTISKSEPPRVAVCTSWWGNDIRHDYTLKGIELFESQNPDITVKTSYAEWTGYQQTYAMKMAAGKEADVMLINYSWLSQYSYDGTGYYDLSQLSDIIDFSGYTKSELSLGRRHGVLNAVPTAFNVETFYYNTDLYQKYGCTIPQTWDELFACADRMNGVVYPMALASKPCWFICIAHEEQRSGVPLIETTGNLGFKRENFIAMFEFYRQLVDRKVMPKVEEFDRQAITTGSYAGFSAWMNDAESHTKQATEKGWHYGVGPVIQMPESKRFGWYVKPATMYAISAHTKHPEESARLLNFLINDTEMAKLQGIEKGVPICDNTRDSIDASKMPLQYTAFTYMEDNFSSFHRQSPELENEKLISAFFGSCQSVYYQQSEAKDEADKLFELFSLILD